MRVGNRYYIHTGCSGNSYLNSSSCCSCRPKVCCSSCSRYRYRRTWATCSTCSSCIRQRVNRYSGCRCSSTSVSVGNRHSISGGCSRTNCCSCCCRAVAPHIGTAASCSQCRRLTNTDYRWCCCGSRRRQRINRYRRAGCCSTACSYRYGYRVGSCYCRANTDGSRCSPVAPQIRTAAGSSQCGRLAHTNCGRCRCGCCAGVGIYIHRCRSCFRTAIGIRYCYGVGSCYRRINRDACCCSTGIPYVGTTAGGCNGGAEAHTNRCRRRSSCCIRQRVNRYRRAGCCCTAVCASYRYRISGRCDRAYRNRSRCRIVAPQIGAATSCSQCG